LRIRFETVHFYKPVVLSNIRLGKTVLLSAHTSLFRPNIMGGGKWLYNILAWVSMYATG